ncbi:hypothetical protein QFZ67_004960 [Streptomyces sp. V1I1]|nr:hypothetical protein [Streptomyces sp. V1I1]
MTKAPLPSPKGEQGALYVRGIGGGLNAPTSGRCPGGGGRVRSKRGHLMLWGGGDNALGIVG